MPRRWLSSTLHLPAFPPFRLSASARHIAKHAVLVLLCVWVLLPLVWVVLHSVKDGPFRDYHHIWPREFRDPLWANYRMLWRNVSLDNDFYRSLSHSAVVTGLTVLSTTIAATLAGYALARLRTPGAKIVLGLLVASMFFPTQVTALTGIFRIQYRLGLIDRTWSLFFPYTAMCVAISVFVMRGVFQMVPTEVIDSAKLDGAGSLRILFGILLPLVRNGIIVVMILAFNFAWGEYLLGATLTNSRESWTLAVVVGGGVGVGPGSAALLIIAILPALVVFGLAQRWFLKGLQDGALRG